MMNKRRSIGITSVGILMLMYSLWFLGGIIFDYSEFLPESMLFFTPSDFMNSQGGWFLPPLIGIIFFIFSIGILKLKDWARKFTVYFSALIFFLSSILLFSGGGIGMLVIIPFLPSVIFLIFFTRTKIKEQFK